MNYSNINPNAEIFPLIPKYKLIIYLMLFNNYLIINLLHVKLYTIVVICIAPICFLGITSTCKYILN